MKVFISYSTHDRALAERLFEEVHAAGAEVFQYSKTARAGISSWKQVLTWIAESDVFIVLVSQSALDSQPVAEEIDHAHHSYINVHKPSRIIPAIIENGAKPPILIARFARVDLISYEGGVGELFGQLGLKRKPASSLPAKVAPLPDLSALFFDYHKTHPEPSPVRQWSARAAEIVTNYNAVAPGEISKDVGADHIDTILAELSGKKGAPGFSGRFGKYNSLLLGLQPPGKGAAASRLLEAPKLSASLDGSLSWNAIVGASEYVVEQSRDPDFRIFATEVYRGPHTKYSPQLRLLNYSRVKAVGDLWRESEWSNTVEAFNWRDLLATTVSPSLTAPKLSNQGAALTWTEVAGASGYVLERSADAIFGDSEVVYEGTATTHLDYTGFVRNSHYRVKAKSGKGTNDSAWSNTVRSDPPAILRHH